MSESWRDTVTNVSNRIFPGLSLYHPYMAPEFYQLGNEIVSNLPLQMALYFNAVFIPIWLVTAIVMLCTKFVCLSYMYRFILVTVLLSSIVIECLRIYLGYVGNLAEKVPELAGFWMLSILLQLPLQMFLLLNGGSAMMPVELIVQSVMLILLLAQLIAGFIALRKAARHQANHYKLMQLHGSPEQWKTE